MAQRPRTAEATEFLVAFGRHIRALRRERGLSQERLGDLTGLDRQTMNRLENAAHAISTAHLGALARALDVPAADLMPAPGDYARADYAKRDRVPEEHAAGDYAPRR